MAPLFKGWNHKRIRCGCTAIWVAVGVAVVALAPCSPTLAAPRLVDLVALRVDAGATVALPRTWVPPQLGHDAPIPTVASTINSPFGPSRLVFAWQAPLSEGFSLVTVRRSDFSAGTPRYLEKLPARDLAILLNHVESRVHGDRPAWASRLTHSKPPTTRRLGGHRVIYWEGEWHTTNDRIAMVRGYAFFGNGAVYLLRSIGVAGFNQPEFAEEARFADAVAATFSTK